MAQDGHLCGGAWVGAWIYTLALLEYLRGGGWRPDRSHLFGPPQLKDLDRPEVVRKMDVLVTTPDWAGPMNREVNDREKIPDHYQQGLRSNRGAREPGWVMAPEAGLLGEPQWRVYQPRPADC